MHDITPMMRQYHEIKRAHPGKLLLFRLGDFYELFYEDAVIASRELGITLTSRGRDRHGRPIPMCGVPYHSVDGYIARLLRRGYKIAICEQVEDPKSSQKLVRREVVRIVTPGTAVQEMLLEPKENSFLASICADGGGTGLAFLDLSTGEFKATEFVGEDSYFKLIDEVQRFQPREILYPEPAATLLERKESKEAFEGIALTPLQDWAYNLDYARRLLLEQFEVATLDGFGCEDRSRAIAAAGALIHYVLQTQKAQLKHIGALSYYETSDYLKLDPTTVANLELVRTLDSRNEPTLYSVLDFTRTRMGGRLLRSWILRPLLDVRELEARLDSVADLKRSAALQDRLSKILSNIHDLERLTSKIALGTASARDLVTFRNAIKHLPELKELLGDFSAAKLRTFQIQLDDLSDIYDLLERAIADDPPATLTDGGLIRDGYDAELDELRAICRDGKSFIAQLEAKERQRTGISSLKVKYNQVFGYFIEVSRSNLRLVPPDYVRKQTLANAERFVTDELKRYEEKVLGAEERILELERQLFISVRQAVAAEASRIIGVARIVAELDVLRSFAEAAMRYRYVRPELTDGDEIMIKDGRHPVVERQIQPFIPNDLYINTTTDQLLIITGPNMGGKSTFLRQAALIVIMAQMGSFVPASSARIGLVDQIFTRVGASDSLARGRSTFMQEMIETAKILNTATPRSLILLDEVGRGTATFDGLSIAWAVAEYLHNTDERRARTLFATHYHELTKLANVLTGVKNYNVAIKDAGKEIVFLHKVVPGSADRSYGIEVARLAGLPQIVLQRARDILKRLERKEIDLSGGARSRAAQEAIDQIQGSLF